MWKIYHNILPVKENLRRRRIHTTGDCPICQQGPESMEHALLLCPWTRSVWFGLQIGVLTENRDVSNLAIWLEQRMEEIQKLPTQKEFALTTLSCALWGIWKTRNEFMFEGKKPDPRTTLIQISTMISDYGSLIPNKKKVPSHNVRVHHPWRPPPQV